MCTSRTAEKAVDKDALLREQPFPFTGSKYCEFFPVPVHPLLYVGVPGFRKCVGIMSIYMATASLKMQLKDAVAM